MSQAVVVEENRSFLGDVRKKIAKAVDSGFVKKTLDVFDGYVDFSVGATKAIVNITGVPVEAVLEFTKIDGEFGEEIAAAIKEVLPNILDALGTWYKKGVHSTVNILSSQIIGKKATENKVTTDKDKENLRIIKNKAIEVSKRAMEMKASQYQNRNQEEPIYEDIIDAEYREVEEGSTMHM